jgi:protease I
MNDATFAACARLICDKRPRAALVPLEKRMSGKVLIMATNRFEESELFGPREILLGEGFEVTLASPDLNEIVGTVHDAPGRKIKPDITISEAREADFDALLLPGGVGNPDQLRMNEQAVALVKPRSLATRRS